jgi:hypothetical protein
VARRMTEGEDFENLFELVEGFGAKGLQAVLNGEGVFLLGEGQGLLEGRVVGPGVDGGTGDVGELGSRGHGGACGEGLKDRDLGDGERFHCDFIVIVGICGECGGRAGLEKQAVWFQRVRGQEIFLCDVIDIY